MSADDSLRRDLEAAIGARRDLGREYEVELIDSFVEKVERRIDQRLDERLVSREEAPNSAGLQSPFFVLAVVSLGTGIPISAISAGIAGLPGLVVAWLGIVGVNAAHALGGGSRARRDRRW